MKPTSSTESNLKNNILQEIKKRFGQLEYSSLLALARMLDPRFKNFHVNKVIAETKQAAGVSSKSSKEEGNNDYDFWKHHKS